MNGDEFPKPDDTQFISFQDYSTTARHGAEAEIDLGTPTHQRYNLNNEPIGVEGIIEDLQGLPEQRNAKESPGFWTLDYYKKYFNVDTEDVLLRIKKSMIPSGQDNYLLSHIRPNPDLYGPFWICVTLIFAIAISGNVANYFQTANSGKYHWKYEFHLVSYAATAICLYVWLLPLGLWGTMKWTKAASQNNSMDIELIETHQDLGLLELLCLYGYSLFIYIPVAFLWTIQIEWFQWTLVIVATILSGGVLIRSLLPLITNKQKPIYIAIILGLHLLLAIGFMRFFFHVPERVVTEPSNQTVQSTISILSENVTKIITQSSTKSS
ncbi:protein YIPF1 isoform X2 [Chelonus insularis]|uniref:protein YIPF1 isoform X2 n=1 Tax=Chelonus insularis TaxID=460826 RepID=UPI00158E7CFA|nr:protein YIPF1 isoform X2 [Chelonus insularis]